MTKTYEVRVNTHTNSIEVYGIETDKVETMLFSLDKKEAIGVASDIARCVKGLKDPRWNQF